MQDHVCQAPVRDMDDLKHLFIDVEWFSENVVSDENSNEE